MNLKEAKELVRAHCWVEMRVSRDPWTFVRVKAYPKSTGLCADGFAKRMWRDKPDAQLGYEIAKGRAIVAMARQLMETNHGE